MAGPKLVGGRGLGRVRAGGGVRRALGAIVVLLAIIVIGNYVKLVF